MSPEQLRAMGIDTTGGTEHNSPNSLFATYLEEFKGLNDTQIQEVLTKAKGGEPTPQSMLAAAVDLGYVKDASEFDLKHFDALHEKSTDYGTYLVETGLCTQEQIDEVLESLGEEATPTSIGQALVDEKILRRDVKDVLLAGFAAQKIN